MADSEIHSLNLRILLLFILATILFVSSPSRADYETGVLAWESGSYRQAIAEWMAAANVEDSRAMLSLGRAYARGFGVLQDFVEAHKWFILAASYGIPEAAKERDALDARITEAQRTEAQSLAKQWQPGIAANVTTFSTQAENEIGLDDTDLAPLPIAEILEPRGLIVISDSVISPGTSCAIKGARP